MKYADDLALLAKEETVLQGMFEILMKLEDFMEWKGIRRRLRLSESQGNRPEYSYDK